MNTLASMLMLTDQTGTFAVIVIGDETGMPVSTLVSYGQRQALEAVEELSIPRKMRKGARARIMEALSPEPNARAIEFAGASEAAFARCIAIGLEAYVDETPIDTDDDWHAEVPRFRSMARDNLTFVSTYDSARNRFLAALVEDRDNLPRRYRAVAARLYDGSASADGVEIGRDVIVLPEALAAVYAIGRSVLSGALRKLPNFIRSTVRIRDGIRPYCVLLCGAGDMATELRWTHGAAQARAWVEAASGIAQTSVAAVSEQVGSMPDEAGPSYAVTGEVGALMAQAFAVGHALVSNRFGGYNVVPGTLVRRGATVNGRGGMALVIHAEKGDRKYRAALLDDAPSLRDFYLANLARIHGTDDDLGPDVRGILIVPLPDSLTLTIVTGMVNMTEEQGVDSN